MRLDCDNVKVIEIINPYKANTMARKKGSEAKAERTTWFAMILVFALLRFDTGVNIPQFLLPFIIGTILVIGGVYQLSHKWPVSPFTWIIAAILFLFSVWTFIDTLPALPIDMVLVSIVATIIHIVIGIVSNES